MGEEPQSAPVEKNEPGGQSERVPGQALPLAGIRVLDLTRLYPGPLATMWMGDLGADVIKIEEPGRPDYMRFFPPFVGEDSAAYLALNRSKRSFACNLAEPEGRDLFFALVGKSDVVIEQFRPGVLDKMGLSYEQARLRRPEIVYVSITGYGQCGPYAGQAGHDINYLGLSGLLDSLRREGSGPAIPAGQIADIAGGSYMAVIGTLAALWQRSRTGQGQRVDVSMLDGALPLLTLELAQFWAGGPTEAERMPLSGAMACYGVYECADGKFAALAAFEEKFWRNFCEFAERPDWVGLQRAPEEQEELARQVREFFLTKPRDAWISEASTADICLTPVLNLGELDGDPHLATRKMFVERSPAAGGLPKCLAMPLKFPDARPFEYLRAAPLLGEHTREILEDLGCTPAKIVDLENRGIVGRLAGRSSVL